MKFVSAQVRLLESMDNAAHSQVYQVIIHACIKFVTQALNIRINPIPLSLKFNSQEAQN